MKVWSLVITAAYKTNRGYLPLPQACSPRLYHCVGFLCARVLELEIEIALLMPGGRAFFSLVVVSLEFLPLSGILWPRALGVMG